MPVDVFVSYSHEDTALVSPVVKLLRINKSLVFHDVDSIEPGKKWREEIHNALASARLVVLFWCIHSSESQEVKAEYQAAIRSEKDVLPVILDATPLAEELKAFQWIDFSEALRSHDGLSGQARQLQAPQAAPQAAPQPAPRSKRAGLYGMAVALVALVVLASFTFGPRVRQVESTVLVWILSVLLGVAIAVAVVRTIVVRRRTAELRERLSRDTGQFEVPWDVDLAIWQRNVAAQLESHILDRVGSPRSSTP